MFPWSVFHGRRPAWLVLLALALTACAPTADSPVQPAPTGTPLLTDAMRRDAETMARQLGIPTDEALQAAANQQAIGELNARLEQQEAETFAGLWIEYKPQYRVVVSFTRDGPETIRRYVQHTSLEPFIQVQTAKRSLAELARTQQQLGAIIQELGLPFSSATNIQENVVELYVTDRALLERELQRTGRALPQDVKWVVIYEPLGDKPPFPLTPASGVAMPQLRARSAGFMLALAVGKLVVQDGCLRLGQDLIIWQPDYFLNDRGGTLEVLDRTGKIVGRVGDEIRMGGGEIPLTAELERQLRAPIPAKCSGPYWLMGTIETAP